MLLESAAGPGGGRLFHRPGDVRDEQHVVLDALEDVDALYEGVVDRELDALLQLRGRREGPAQVGEYEMGIPASLFWYWYWYSGIITLVPPFRASTALCGM